ncbi:MAG TPA: efflux RND transporter permease subunit [Elusimicrobiota bacterium]|nr:efflux RND transporter permease subunit [Elusimicrobiota bacterium]
MKTESMGLAGRLAKSFVHSKLTPLLAVTALFLGVFAVLKLSREEEPQINVPLFDVFVPYPGASAEEVEQRVLNVGERKLWEIPGVEYIYSTAESHVAFFIVRFKVGINPELAMTQIYTKTFANLDLLPPGAGQPLIKPRSIDDVPILALTFTSPSRDPRSLRAAVAALREEISAVPLVSDIDIIGGRRRQFKVHFDPARMAEHRVTPLELGGILQSANTRLPAGHVHSGGEDVSVESDSLIRTASDLKEVVVGVSRGRPVTVDDVARVEDGPDEDEKEVWLSPASSTAPSSQAVTLAVSKRRGANATDVAGAVLRRIDRNLKEPGFSDIRYVVTRNYGDTAKEKSDELLFHMLLATLSVTVLIALALGLREALVVLVAIPVTLSLTLLIYYLFGYTLNRITLFALIFSIGILVDDAIVVVENIHRHYTLRDGRNLWDLAVHAVNEVGNPTFLATWAVIAAILPMAFVSGLMGPYMRPIPVGASMAMLFSLLVAFVVSPWMFTWLLQHWKPKDCHNADKEGFLDRLYRNQMRLLLENGRARAMYLGVMGLLLAGAVALVPLQRVTVKMLPFDNKDEFEVVLNMPESSSLDKTREVSDRMAAYLRGVPDVERVVSYVGTSAPHNFNGLVRHYFLRQKPHQADIVVNLKPRHARRRQSHEIASRVRLPLQSIADQAGARIQVAEVPPGPPVLSTLVLEFYGPDLARQRFLVSRVKELLRHTDGIVDVDSYVPDARRLDSLKVLREKATLNGISAESVAQTVSMAVDGQTVRLAHTEGDREPVEIRLRLPDSKRRDLRAVGDIRLLSRNGVSIPLRELVRAERTETDIPIHHKNLRRVSYVIADVAGRAESPVYAILKLRKDIDRLAREEGIPLKQYYSAVPESSSEVAMKWDGEWQITYEVFRDLGVAFAMVLLLIYILVVAWFQSFTIPLVIMAPIPLTLVGILPGHWGMNAFFTATSMIGFIAGAGIVVRNSIILVDFIQLRLREGMPLKEAVIDAGAIRFRPMLLTAAAVVVGAGVILFDPIFQGLAVSLMAGEVASTVLSRTAVPVLYYMLAKRHIVNP